MKTSKIGLFVLAAIVAATFVPAFGQDLDEPALELAQIGPTDDGVQVIPHESAPAAAPAPQPAAVAQVKTQIVQLKTARRIKQREAVRVAATHGTRDPRVKRIQGEIRSISSRINTLENRVKNLEGRVGIAENNIKYLRDNPLGGTQASHAQVYRDLRGAGFVTGGDVAEKFATKEALAQVDSRAEAGVLAVGTMPAAVAPATTVPATPATAGLDPLIADPNAAPAALDPIIKDQNAPVGATVPMAGTATVASATAPTPTPSQTAGQSSNVNVTMDAATAWVVGTILAIIVIALAVIVWRSWDSRGNPGYTARLRRAVAPAIPLTKGSTEEIVDTDESGPWGGVRTRTYRLKRVGT
ncbi:hypothetical protein COT78_03035 [Candidatus Berkelbacteria bacterium CG10_big_fil_rev_8_21_14_0_10_43_13]|uniref:DUF5667 domain-containing protein n=1 Tax=Candidatus Berkelbacteria bacterium CG10_big_fil_rev_8_21_14_0_10_43_13 TaxID=1974514 RepID=A0A2H0W8G4_9BACT|nr:MAG: hypothetical protein COT78_03035 [Candidatus Berkelbacteria bacterium CG10_big_fil_rev_8_21_14_0_10_43_13]